jgi:hypothetical protein
VAGLFLNTRLRVIFAHLVRFSSRPYRQQTGRRGSIEEEAPGLPDYNQVTNGRTALFIHERKVNIRMKT